MFEQRLRVFLFVLLLAGAVLVVRLFDLQVVRADYYRQRARQSLLLEPETLPFVRGRILDRTGEVLVQDEASWAVTVDYPMLAASISTDPARRGRWIGAWRGRFSEGWKQWRSRFGPHSTREERVAALQERLDKMWPEIARLSASGSSPHSVAELRAGAGEICDRVERIREAVAIRRGFDSPVAEETTRHAVLTGLSGQEQIEAKEVLGRFPWAHVDPKPTRCYVGDAAPLAHVLGRLGRVDAETVDNDPNADDPLASYRPDEVHGITGMEYVAEQTLRGRRGLLRRDRRDKLVGPVIEAVNGKDAVLTIHAELQRRLYHILGDAVEDLPESSGGAIVVLDVPTREVLALVSYPSFDPSRFDELYPTLRDDTDRLPLRFRPVQNAYAPGSTIKPLVCAAGLMGGYITLDTVETCTGYLFDNVRDRWRCWKIHGTNQRMAHGTVDVVKALRESCNVFMYRLGSRIGVDGITSAFGMAGIGEETGTGLKEERRGINPTPSLLMTRWNRAVHPGHARLFAIGQGEILMTPLQVANLMAIYASGRYRHVTLLQRSKDRPEWILPVKPEHWAAIREGVYEVVNDPRGTAYDYAHFVNDQFALCGKTGSATAFPWPTSFRIPYVDSQGHSRVTIVRAGAKRPATERFEADFPGATFDPDQVEIAGTWPTVPPPPGERFSHAWFGGYLQPLDAAGRPDFSKEPQIAFSILVEFGGSGGRTSGPLAKRVAAEILDALHGAGPQDLAQAGASP